jgi:membrane-bound metal-dependent hydrolase YbcI (DUF457 family)
MPFTPLHMGPGIAIKAVMQRHLSLMVFGWSQIIIDLQPLYVMLRNKGELHGFSHTYLGATLIALFCTLTGKPLGEFGLRLIREAQHLPIRWSTAIVSAFIGTWSHVFIDSIMHSDINPLSPFSAANGLYNIISIEALHVVCLATAVIGGAVYFGVDWFRKRRFDQSPEKVKSTVYELVQAALSRKALQDLQRFFQEDDGKRAAVNRFLFHVFISTPATLAALFLVNYLISTDFSLAAQGTDGTGYFLHHESAGIVRHKDRIEKKTNLDVAIVEGRNGALLRCQSNGIKNLTPRVKVSIQWESKTCRVTGLAPTPAEGI